MSECNHNCSECESKCSEQKAIKKENANEFSRIKKVIGIVSGKGGVGKSLITAMLATVLQRRGYVSAILDADITGPSIPKMFGIKERAKGTEGGILPSESKFGTKIMSTNLLLENETDPVVWRGPMIAEMVKQFWTEVVWGEVDYMFVDMPPGTGDVPLTVFQSLPVDGVIVVASPQEMVGVIVEKAVNMAGMMNIPIIGFVENMSYFSCPKCGERVNIFGDGRVEETAKRFGVDSVSKIPIDPALAKACDSGTIELFFGDWLEKLADKIERL